MVFFFVLSIVFLNYGIRPLSVGGLILALSCLISALKFFVEMETATKLKSIGTVFGILAVLLSVLAIALLARQEFRAEKLLSLLPGVVFALIGGAFWWGGIGIARIKPGI